MLSEVSMGGSKGTEGYTDPTEGSVTEMLLDEVTCALSWKGGLSSPLPRRGGGEGRRCSKLKEMRGKSEGH